MVTSAFRKTIRTMCEVWLWHQRPFGVRVWCKQPPMLLLPKNVYFMHVPMAIWLQYIMYVCKHINNFIMPYVFSRFKCIFQCSILYSFLYSEFYRFGWSFWLLIVQTTFIEVGAKLVLKCLLNGYQRYTVSTCYWPFLHIYIFSLMKVHNNSVVIE